ncbi:MAG TPA: AmmeMemoRadiSam system protein A [Coriobacteriia bacterium]
MPFDVLGIIAPHPPIMVEAVGGEDARVTAVSAAALRKAANLLDRFAPQTVVIVSPHAPGFADAFTVTTAGRVRGDLSQFSAPRATHDVAGDPELARAIIDEATAGGLPIAAREEYPLLARELDHGVLVPMSFLDPAGRYDLVEASFTFLPAADHVEFGRAIRRAATRVGRRIALVASGDCSHRLKRGAPAGYSPRGHLFDEQLAALLARSDYDGVARIDEGLREEAGECGWRSFLILGGFLEGTDAVTRVLSYEGPWGVGYLTAVAAPLEELSDLPSFTPETGEKGGRKADAESAPVRLARETIESYVRDGTIVTPPAVVDPVLPPRAGAFVSLHLDGLLRGCIGTTEPTRATLGEEIVRNAVQAATQDPRFPPVRPEELAGLEIKVDVLHPPQRIETLEELDPRIYGVITTCGWRRGLLLPDLEGVDTCEDQVAIAMSKAGIATGEPISLERFKVDRYE